MTIKEASEKLEKGEITSAKLIEDYLAKIKSKKLIIIRKKNAMTISSGNSRIPTPLNIATAIRNSNPIENARI